MPTNGLNKREFETLSDFRYQLRRFLRFSEEVTRKHGVTHLSGRQSGSLLSDCNLTTMVSYHWYLVAKNWAWCAVSKVRSMGVKWKYTLLLRVKKK
jgi:hypothetical protein